MTKADIVPMPEFFDRYINRVDDIDLLTALEQTATFDTLLPRTTAEALGDLRYAPGKWTIRDIIQHLIDTERIMSYRALRFARRDQTALPGFDEDRFSESARATQRTVADLYDEYAALRQSSLALFRSFDDDMVRQTGICFNKTISVLGIGYVLTGHVLHHIQIVEERYLPLLTQR